MKKNVKPTKGRFVFWAISAVTICYLFLGLGAKQVMAFSILGIDFSNWRSWFGSREAVAENMVITQEMNLPEDLSLKNILVEGVASVERLKILGLTARTGEVLGVNSEGYVALVKDKVGEVNIDEGSLFNPDEKGNTLFYSGSGWEVANNLFNFGDNIGILTEEPGARLHISTSAKNAIGLVIQAVENQEANMQEWRDKDGTKKAWIDKDGKLILETSSDGHILELRPHGDAGELSSNGGAIFLENTYNPGSGITIFSDRGDDADGNLLNIKSNNTAFTQASIYVEHKGASNAVEITHNGSDASSNALSITNNNVLDSALGIKGHESGRGTVKVTHIGDGSGSDTSASGISIDLQGENTAAQGLYVDSTASTGTSGNLLRLRNQTVDKFVVSSDGDLTMKGSATLGDNGTNTTFTKKGNSADDEFFIGTTGAFRVQRASSNSEAMRMQIVGDTQGRILITSDGRIKWGDGSSTQDATLRRTGAGELTVESDVVISSRGTNNDVMIWNASDGSRLGRLTETSGGHGWLEVDDSSGNSKILFRADGGSSYINSGNVGIGTTSFGTNAAKVLALGNGTAPTDSIADGVQLYAIDYDDGDGTATSELFVRDEDGNATDLSPHVFSLIPEGRSEDMAWAYYSEKDGKAINVDMAKVVRLVEQLSGEDLVHIYDLDKGEEMNGKQPSVMELVNGLLVKTKAKFMDLVSFGDGFELNGKAMGKVIIPGGNKKVKVTFGEKWNEVPEVFVTSRSEIGSGYRVSEVSESGFVLELSEKQEKETEFGWMAIKLNEDKEAGVEILE